MMNASCKLSAGGKSFIREKFLTINGMTAPPTIDMIRTADPSNENFPKPLIPNENIEGNNIELNSPMRVIAQIGIPSMPEVRMETRTSMLAIPAVNATATLGFILSSR